MIDSAKGLPCRLAGVLVVATAAVAAQAFVLIPVSFEELARRADYVVVGRVTGQEARYNDDRTLILTHTTIEVEESIAGNPPAKFEISDFGGRVGNEILTFTGQVPYRTGESVLVFVRRDTKGRLRTCGAHQGRFELVEAASGKREARGLTDGRMTQHSLADLRARIHAAREVSR